MLAQGFKTAALFGGSIIVIIVILVLGGVDTHLILSASSATSNTRVAAGGNGASWDSFSPQGIKINRGDSVTWFNPSSVAEPHTVTFVFNDKTMTAVDTPFAVPNSTKFIPLPPGSNSEPNMIPSKDGMNIVIVSNGRAYNPTVIESTGSIKTAPPNASFTIAGNEQYVSSGFIVPKIAEKAFPGSSNTFTATFQKGGTYYYLCLLHPWMGGAVIVTS
jgi:plastocyanin